MPPAPRPKAGRARATTCRSHGCSSSWPARGVERLLVEAGGDLLFQFLAADAIDEMYLTLCPLVVGGDAPSLADGAGFDLADAAPAAPGRGRAGRRRGVPALPRGRQGREPMKITIRRATPADAAGFARVMSDPAVYPGLMQLPFNNEHQWRERLAESTGAGKIDLVLVAERDGSIVGNSGLHPECAAAARASAPRRGDRHRGRARGAGAGRRHAR